MLMLSNNNNDNIINAIKTVYDTEIPVNIYEMGLIYKIDNNDGQVTVTMTLTAPNCPEAERLPNMVRNAILSNVEGVKDVEIIVTFEPPWTPKMMSEEAQIALEMI